jgi:hypothetical protein
MIPEFKGTAATWQITVRESIFRGTGQNYSGGALDAQVRQKPMRPTLAYKGVDALKSTLNTMCEHTLRHTIHHQRPSKDFCLNLF